MFCHMCWRLPQTYTNTVFNPVPPRQSDVRTDKNVVCLSSLMVTHAKLVEAICEDTNFKSTDTKLDITILWYFCVYFDVMYSGEYHVFDVTLSVYPHRAGWKVSLTAVVFIYARVCDMVDSSVPESVTLLLHHQSLVRLVYVRPRGKRGKISTNVTRLWHTWIRNRSYFKSYNWSRSIAFIFHCVVSERRRKHYNLFLCRI